MQNILLDGCCLLFEEYLQDIRSVYILKPNRAEKETKVLKQVYEEVSMLRKKIYFEWIFKQLLNLYDVKNYADLGGYLLTWTIDHLWQKNGSKRTDDI